MYILKKKFNYLNILPWSDLKDEIKNFDIIINATSLGLKKQAMILISIFLTLKIILYILIQFIIH